MPPLDFLSLHPFVRLTVVDKVHGLITGSALGDTIGIYTGNPIHHPISTHNLTPLEFLSASQAQESYPTGTFTLLPLTPIRADMHRDKFTASAWTDDTDHALLLLLSYLHHGRLDAGDFGLRLRSWTSQGLRVLSRPPCGLGRTVRDVTSHTEFPDPCAARAVWERGGRAGAANGSLMRTHPLGVIGVGMELEEAWEAAATVGSVTHCDSRCVVACCVVVGLLRGILRGEVRVEEDVDAVAREAFTWVLDRGAAADADALEWEEFRRHVWAGSLDELQLDDARTMGYVYKALGSAVLLLRRGMRAGSTDGNVFQNLIQELVMAGGDADTNACVAGALLGCWVGYSGIPAEWKDGIMHKQWLLEKTDGLCQTVGIVAGDYKGSEDLDTAFDGGKGLMELEELREVGDRFLGQILEKMKARDDAKKAEKDKGKRPWWKRVP